QVEGVEKHGAGIMFVAQALGPRCQGLASLLRLLNQIALASDALPKYSDLAWQSGCVRYLLSSNLPRPRASRSTIFLVPVTCVTGSGLLCELSHTWTSLVILQPILGL